MYEVDIGRTDWYNWEQCIGAVVKRDHDTMALCNHEFDSRQLHHVPLTKISIEIFVRVHGTATKPFVSLRFRTQQTLGLRPEPEE